MTFLKREYSLFMSNRTKGGCARKPTKYRYFEAFSPFSFEEIFSLVVELDPVSPGLLLALLHDLLRPLLESL